MEFFFFGSLMDRDVAEAVLGRALESGALTPAVLHGFVRLTVAEESYPALAPRAGGRVAGMLLRGVSRADLARLQFFESEEFTPQLLDVELASRERVRARVFVASESLRVGEQAWDYRRWLREEKADFLALTRQWMAEFGRRESHELEESWRSAREQRERARAHTDNDADNYSERGKHDQGHSYSRAGRPRGAALRRR